MAVVLLLLPRIVLGELLDFEVSAPPPSALIFGVDTFDVVSEVVVVVDAGGVIPPLTLLATEAAPGDGDTDAASAFPFLDETAEIGVVEPTTTAVAAGSYFVFAVGTVVADAETPKSRLSSLVPTGAS